MDNQPATFIKCKCDEVFEEKDFLGHFPSCLSFKRDFKSFDQKFGEILREYSDPKENLLIVKVLLNQYQKMIENKIKQLNIYVPNPNQNNIRQPMQQPYRNGDMNNNNNSVNLNNNNINVNNNGTNNNGNIRPNPNINQPINQNNNNSNNNQNKPQYDDINKLGSINLDQNNNTNIKPNKMDIDQFLGNKEETPIESCQFCHNPNFNYLECFHPICTDCLYNLANSDFSCMKCKTCQQEISNDYKMQVMGKNKFEEYERRSMDKFFKPETIKTCINPKCKESFIFEHGKVDPNARDEKGQKLSQSNAEHYAMNRCRCPKCDTDFCIGCSKSPYHLGNLLIYHK